MQRLIARALLLLLAAGCAAALAHVLSALPARISLDPNEGWNAYHALAFRSGGALYPPADGLFINNYPPLSFVLVGALGGIVGDDIVAGRLVSLLSLGSILAGVIASLRLLRCGWLAALFGALFLLAGLLIFSDYVGMDDPQMLGHAIGMGALVLILSARARGASVLYAALLCALAFFVKHNLVVLPAALTLWLLLAGKARQAVLFALAYLTAACTGILLVDELFAVKLVAMLASARRYDLGLLKENIGAWLAFGLAPLVILLALLWTSARRDAGLWFCVIYAALALGAGTYFFGGAGVDMNAMFDADIALSLVLGLALTRLPQRALVAMAAAAPLVLGVLRAYDPLWLAPSFWLHPYADEKAGAEADIAFLRDRPGPALCETLALCYWAGKPAAVDVFNLGEAYATGARSDAPLLALIAGTRFSAIQLEAPATYPLGPRVAAALSARYRLDYQNGSGAFLEPR